MSTKFSGEQPADSVTVCLDGREMCLSRGEALALRHALSEQLAAEREFLHTVGRHRPDGSYVVERRNADADGNAKVFESVAALRSLYDSLPARFEASDLDRPGVSGGRRHMLLWHVAEHPAFDCSLVARQPLTVEKEG